MQDELLARRERGEVLPDRTHNERMAKWEAELDDLRRRRSERKTSVALRNAALDRLEALMPSLTGIEDEPWVALTPRQRN